MNDIKKKINIKKNKENSFTLIEVVVITLAFSVLTSIIAGYVVYRINNKNLILDRNLIDIVDSYNKIINDYYGDVDKEKLSDSAIDGMMNELNEQYSVYMDDADTEDLNSKLDGSYDGIGVQIAKIENKVIIINVYDNTPASISGLKANDVLTSIDDYQIKDDDTLDYLVSLIKDKSKVNLTVMREDKELEFKIDIKTIDYPVVEYKIFEEDENKIGYIYLSSFSDSSTKQVKNVLASLEKENIDSLIFDVRSNTGGYLDAATDIASIFIKKGKTLYTLENNDGKKVIYDETNEERKYEMVVLIDGATASASEILAASLKESYGAILVGTQTYGKGKVQQTSVLSDKTMIKYTTANWYTPNGDSIDGIGLTPGIAAVLTEKYVENPIDENDEQLQKALSLLKK